ncbi:UDP-glucuronosyltransferase 2B7-like isoform X1 [Apodemus sylvaticus]|uniref:UDP-glucuronosyltransferase 2B7-like isoform X1 n=1 Tax=Apodemus sylvaticus TaxID=10129 RepID=UPI0022418E20|nr:UDP-glucuronosyltransferase 2B7-like isoform X1 [Apodemus sylvaticus]
MPIKWISALLLLQISFCFRSGNCGKVLVWPMEYSHWMNLKIILDELVQRGHEVTVLRPSTSIFHDPQKASGFIYETFPSASNSDEVEKFVTQWVNMWTYDVPKGSCLRYYPALNIMFGQFSNLWLKLCREAVSNKQLMAKLKEYKFDVVLSDAIGPCSELIAELLELPFVYSLRFGNGYGIEKFSGGQLFPPSYVPIILSGLSGQMTFMERVQNMICLLYFDLWFESFPSKDWDPFFSEILGRPTTMVDTMKKAEMWLIRSYWDLEFPRPSLPNIEFVGGLHCKPAKSLPKEMEEFAQSSGEHGVVVISLGSMIRNITQERANTIATALAQIPQKVLWRFEGKKPDTLGPNTRVFKWLPQNDLLGHPKTKAFVTHGGANGIYESIHHGIPMVGIPLFAEQHDNIAHMVAKGAAVSVDFHTMSSADLLSALKAVINNPSYKEKVMWLSTIHHDQPMKPLDRAVFWIEFVMRHKGAKHLRPLAHNLTWYQYHSLDVIGFLLACVVAIAFLAVKCCLFVYRFFIKMRKNKKD